MDAWMVRQHGAWPRRDAWRVAGMLPNTQPGIGTGRGRKRCPAHVAAARFRFGFRIFARKHQPGGAGGAELGGVDIQAR